MKEKLSMLSGWLARLSAGLKRVFSHEAPCEQEAYNPRRGQVI